MKHILKILTVLMMVVLFGSGAFGQPMQQAPSGKTIKYAEEEVVRERTFNYKKRLECGDMQNPIRVAGYVTNPPFGWMDILPAEGTIPERYVNDGFSYQLFVKLATDLGYKTQNVGFKSYYDAVNALKAGKIDVLLSSYYDKRTLGAGTSILFPGYFSNPIIVVFMKGRERPVSQLSDLKGLKGIVRQEEMLYSLFYQAIPADVKIEQVVGARKAYTMLMKGQADFMITSLSAAEAEARRFKVIEEVVLTQTPIIQPEMFFVFGGNSKCLSLKKEFAEAVEKEKNTPRAINALLFQQIDKWINRFRYAPPLAQELNGAAIDTRKELSEDKMVPQ